MELLEFNRDPERQKPLRIKFIVMGGGGGHYATYNALSNVLKQKNLPWEISATDTGELTKQLAKKHRILDIFSLFGTSASESYTQVQQKRWVWLQWLLIPLYKVLIKLNYKIGKKFLEEHWREEQPDLVVSLIPLFNQMLWESLESVKPGTPMVTVFIDFADSPPAFWIEPKTESYLVCGTEKAVEQARSLGVRENLIIKTSGMVIHPRFYESSLLEQATSNNIKVRERQRLGLDPNCLTGLVMFGANGSKVMPEIAQRLAFFQDKLQLILICGHNEKLASTLRESQGLQKRFITTFTEEIPYYMSIADFFIGKPGPGCISEALAMNLPVIVERSFATLPQERYNTHWIEQKELGVVIPSYRDIQNAVEQFLEPEIFNFYRARVSAINNQAVFEIPGILQRILATHYPSTTVEPLNCNGNSAANDSFDSQTVCATPTEQGGSNHVSG